MRWISDNNMLTCHFILMPTKLPGKKHQACRILLFSMLST